MSTPASATLRHWNTLPENAAIAEVLSICGSHAWAKALVEQRPYSNAARLSKTADSIWWSLSGEDWLEAFGCHPRIGETKTVHASPRSAAWSSQEQAKAGESDAAVLEAIAAGNRHYEEQFGFTYIVCATGKSAGELLTILHRRLASDAVAELREAAEQQRQITQIRLRKWLAS